VHLPTADRRQRGASAVEYALIAAGVAGVVIVGLATLMHVIGARIDCLTGGLQSGGTGTSCGGSLPGPPGGGSGPSSDPTTVPTSDPTPTSPTPTSPTPTSPTPTSPTPTASTTASPAP